MTSTNEMITLKYPFTHQGTDYKELSVRRPKARDSRDAMKGGGTNADNEFRLMANLCEVTPEVIGELDMADYTQLQKVYEGFLS